MLLYVYRLCPNLLNGGIGKDRAPVKKSLLRGPCPLPSDMIKLVLVGSVRKFVVYFNCWEHKQDLQLSAPGMQDNWNNCFKKMHFRRCYGHLEVYHQWCSQ